MPPQFGLIRRQSLRFDMGQARADHAGPMRTPLGLNYWRLWIASVISNLGDGISGVAYPWLASAVTRDPVHIALVGVATRLPWLLFSLPAG